MKKHHDKPEKPHETNPPQTETTGPELTPYVNESETNQPKGETFPPIKGNEPPAPIESVPQAPRVEEPPPEPTFTVVLTASQIKALQDVLSGVSRVPGVTGATPVHDDDKGASTAISQAVASASIPVTAHPKFCHCSECSPQDWPDGVK
jgi:hypothetical protein